MHHRPLSALATALLLTLSAPALAQEPSSPETDPPSAPTTATEPTGEAATPEADQSGPADQAEAAPAEPAGPQEGERYTQATHQSWTVRCLRTSEAEDPCEMHQILTDSNGVETAEISVFPVDRGEAVAGATVITPLNTQLPAGIGLSVDGGPMARYPFIFCNRIGCFSQFGMTAEELSTLKRGANGNLTVVSMGAPDQPVELTISLSGFTAAYDALSVQQ